MPEEHPDNTPPKLSEMNVVIWGCTQCYDYGRVFSSGTTKSFCGKCGGKLVTRNFTFPLKGE